MRRVCIASRIVSDEARAYVKQFSPYRNSTFWVHYALADIANAQHGYELWVADDHLMAEWPFSRSSIHSAYSELVRAGFLTVIEAAQPGRRTRYRFEFIEVEEARPCPMSSKVRTTSGLGSSKVRTTSSKVWNQDLYIEQKETELSRDEIFDALIEVCGLNAKRLTASARGPLNRAVKELRAVGATEDSIRAAAKAYRKKWPEMAISPSAVSKHYAAFSTLKAVRTQNSDLSGQTCEACDGTGFERPDIELGVATLTRCKSCRGMGLAMAGGVS
jgi:hypothetical protein